ncbi:MAG: hypothetical protein MPJ05_04840 [Nitrosopumilus sp.]|nr:hypothetical protein [Nitrosopumilus sp.]
MTMRAARPGMMPRLVLYAALPLANMAILLADSGGPADAGAGVPGWFANIVPLTALIHAHMQLAAYGLVPDIQLGQGYFASVWPALAAFLALFWIPVAYGSCRAWGWIRRLARAGGAPPWGAAGTCRRRLAVYAGLPLANMAAFYLAAGAPAAAASQAVMWASPVAMVVYVYGALLGDMYRDGIPDAVLAAWGMVLALGFAATWVPVARLALALWDRAHAGGRPAPGPAGGIPPGGSRAAVGS